MIALAQAPVTAPAFAEVVVFAPGAAARFHYRVPDALPVAPGHLVVVPFGARRAHGVVVKLDVASPVSETRSIEGLVDPRPVMTSAQIELASWLSERYLAPLGSALELMVPVGMRSSFDQALALRARPVPVESLRLRERRLVEYLADAGPSRLRSVRSRLEMPDAARVAARLAKRGYLDRQPVLVGPRLAARPTRTATMTRNRTPCTRRRDFVFACAAAGRGARVPAGAAGAARRDRAPAR